ncbi:MAG: hypothetical protein GX902_07360, partial [Lentisphaerae bacterium]|nr:hypothetical protein [Lentisphaerota bacterium]
RVGQVGQVGQVGRVGQVGQVGRVRRVRRVGRRYLYSPPCEIFTICAHLRYLRIKCA